MIKCLLIRSNSDKFPILFLAKIKSKEASTACEYARNFNIYCTVYYNYILGILYRDICHQTYIHSDMN